MNTSPRGFALLIAVILTSVTLTVGLALLDVSYKQITLATTAKQSQYAFYNADSVLECALYYDQKFNAFGVGSAFLLTNVLCDNTAVDVTSSATLSNVRTTNFNKTCPDGGVSGTVTVIKNSNTGKSSLYASGYNTCTASDPRRIERGVKVIYGS